MARIGGDEFAILLPGMEAQKAAEVMDQLRKLVSLNNQYYRHPELEPFARRGHQPARAPAGKGDQHG